MMDIEYSYYNSGNGDNIYAYASVNTIVFVGSLLRTYSEALV